MGDSETTSSCPDPPADDFQALLEGATAPRPPAPPECPFCDLPQDRYATPYTGHWILLEPHVLVPAHTVPPRRRWVITSTGTAMNLWDAEPLPGTRCRIPHRVVCPRLVPEDHWPWATALRQHNGVRAQRLFDLPEEGLPDTG
ncbi:MULTISPECIES: DUF6083 domain-containing protein [unclassified Streptomyces]|uniref:DUF6083 domain-containing protein n=1 Tax=unclassified Streptomyces TaxID=2593676 RepID=UPI002E3165A2|nr:DUF6083 domain-containing protein [Streptomyces sp. NBC_01460]WSS25964.1 DUF6083 domain-containing protein [Streptomyces sp. NBC_01185]